MFLHAIKGTQQLARYSSRSGTLDAGRCKAIKLINQGVDQSMRKCAIDESLDQSGLNFHMTERPREETE